MHQQNVQAWSAHQRLLMKGADLAAAGGEALAKEISFA